MRFNSKYSLKKSCWYYILLLCPIKISYKIYTKVFHDRFLILDKKNVYHIGASLKDAGKKCFGISLIEDAGIVRDILHRLEIETEE